jgi:isoleucyl-tRNA synthetase
MLNKFYPDTESEVSFPELEEKVLKFWEEDNTFKKSLEKNNKAEFVFYDGPPFANGLPHYGHLLTSFIKDTIARYQTMLGKKVERRFGWDCHGLPAELAAEKELNISGRKQIQEFGIEKFNDTCRNSVMKYSTEWQKYINRQARWVDFKNDYKTMDLSFMESVIWAFKELYKKGLIYESVKVVPYSWACETQLSNFETRLDNAYREKTSKAITVKFELVDQLFNDGKKCYLVAWTTTPWTLPSNLLLAINTNIKYKAIEKDGCYHIAAEFYHKDENGKYVNPEKLLNLKYKPLFDYFKEKSHAFFISNGDFVQEGEGTGIVHVAPGFGEDDFEIAKKYNIEVVCPVDSSGKFTDEIYDLVGQHVFDTNDSIIKTLKEKGLWLKTEQYVHNYPHCWRTDTPLIYKAVPSWYVKVSAIKDRMVELNQQINWVPAHVKDGLFGNWLENAKDWAISRNRFWGTPIPVWKSNNPKYPRIDVYGSIEELEKDFNVKVNDLHRPHIDNLTRPNPDDPTGESVMVRVEDIFDCWFESGSMPFAQVHYPFDNKERFEENFPADFITEYVAQTRGWFYTLMVISTALFDKPPFKNCICHGIILDTKGQKLSKRLNNYTDPLEIFNKYGADALHFLMMSSPVINGGNLLIDKDGNMVKDVLRLVIKPIWNAYNFFTTYANFHGVKATKIEKSDNVMDNYIISKCYEAVFDRKANLDIYNTNGSCKVIVDFFEILNNWYIRRTRERFIHCEQNAFNTLYTVFFYMLRSVAPVLPLISDSIWLGLGYEKSVHLQDFPIVSKDEIDFKLVNKMDKIRDICKAALFVRNKKNIRVRQPLRALYISIEKQEEIIEFLDLIKDEVNVKKIIINKSELNVEFNLKLNFPVVGKRYPNDVKKMTDHLKIGNWKIVDDNVVLGEFKLKNDEYDFQVHSSDEEIHALSDGKTVIKLDTKVDHELEIEGYARDLIRFIQQFRKDIGLKMQDNKTIKIKTKNENYKECINKFYEDIRKSTYTEKLIISDDLNDCSLKKEFLSDLSIGLLEIDQ